MLYFHSKEITMAEFINDLFDVFEEASDEVEIIPGSVEDVTIIANMK